MRTMVSGMKLSKLLIAGALSVLAMSVQSREVSYITDELSVTLRSGQSTSHSIKRMLPSGAAVEVLERDAATGYSRVRTEQGVDGWVLTRYLMPQPAARQVLKEQTARLARLDDENRRLKQEIAGLTQERDKSASGREELDQENRRLTQELTAIQRSAANVLAIDTENQELKGRVASLERDLLTLREQNAALSDRNSRDWFLVGAGVVVFGMLIGLIIPKIRWRRKPRWDVL